MAGNLIEGVGKIAAEKAALVWSCADDLYGAFKPQEYGYVIIPLTIIKRFDDCLKPTHDAVQETWNKVKNLEVKDGFLRKASGYAFYNTSKFTFDTLLADADNIESNFRDYCNGFSDNVADILARMKWDDMIGRLADPDAPLLYRVLSNFKSEKADFSPDKVSAVDMGYIFENIIRRFSEQDDAGQHFTSRDIIYLMCDLMIACDTDVFGGGRIQKTVWDQAMGTSQMLDCAMERLTALDADAKITTFGQELNPFTFGIAKANALIRGLDADNMRFGDSLAKDQFSGYLFSWAISNPPFGIPFDEVAVKAEHAKGSAGRFPTELPSQGDGQTLFMLNALSHLADDGVMAIIQDASPLYNDKPGKGVDDIRRYVLENDWLDAIVQLPNDAFYNTGIACYVWLFSKAKRAGHEDKVLLIDASKCFVKRRKAMGDKKNDITDECRDIIVKAYGNYCDGEYQETLADGSIVTCEAKLFNSSDFGFNRVNVYTPERDDNGAIMLKKGKPVAKKGKEFKDTEDIPLDEDIDSYIEREVEPYNPGAFVGSGANDVVVGYQIPFTKVFYKYAELEPAEVIAERILEHERVLEISLAALFKDGE